VKFSLVTVVFLLGLSAFVHADAVPDGGYERGDFSRARGERFLEGDWKSLEAEINSARKEESRFVDGTWVLPLLYTAAKIPKTPRARELWHQTMADWEAKAPDSLVRKIIAAQFLSNNAWEARGSGFANTVSDSAWPVFQERLKEARAVLESVPPDQRDCPEWYDVMQTVALGQGWPWPEYEAMTQQGLRRWPDYFDLYFSACYHLLPRWHGDAGDWERFAAKSADSSPLGDELYARMTWSVVNFYDDVFRETEISWPRVKRGFEQMLERFPESNWNRNYFLRFALIARDAETARDLEAKYGNELDERIWEEFTEKHRLNAFLNTGHVPVVIGPDLKWDTAATKNVKESYPTAISLHPDGRRLVVGDNRGSFMVLDIETGKELAAGAIEGGGDIRDLSFSPDGEFLAFALSTHRKRKGGLRVVKFADLQPIFSSDDFAGPLQRVTFFSDGKALFTTGGKVNAQGEIKVWELGSDSLIPHVSAAKRRWNFVASSAVPDSRDVLVDWGTKVVRFGDVASDSVVWGADVPAFVHQILPSKSKPLVYVGRAPAEAQALGSHPAWIALDAATLRPVPGQVPEIRSGITSATLTPDGRHLIGTDWFTHLTTIIDLDEQKWCTIGMGKRATTKLAVASDGEWLVVMDNLGGLLVYDLPGLLKELPWETVSGPEKPESD